MYILRISKQWGVIFLNYTVYMHVSPSRKRYIGITCQEPKKRWLSGHGYAHNDYFTKAINKYGWNNFEHIIVARGLSEDEAKWLEVQMIALYDSTNRSKGYNITIGGDTGHHLMGENNPFYGKHHSEETKDKLRISSSGSNNPRSKKVRCIETGQIYDSAGEASRALGKERSAVRRAIRDNHRAGGYHWEYVS